MKLGLAQRFSLYPLHPPCTDLAQRRQLENRKESKGISEISAIAFALIPIIIMA